MTNLMKKYQISRPDPLLATGSLRIHRFVKCRNPILHIVALTRVIKPLRISSPASSFSSGVA